MALDTKIHDLYINDLLLLAIIPNRIHSIIVLKYKSSQQGGWVEVITLDSQIFE